MLQDCSLPRLRKFSSLNQNLNYLRLLCNILLDAGYKVGYSGEFPNAQLPYSQSIATVGSKTYIAPVYF